MSRPDKRQDPAFLRYYASVLEREASIRGGEFADFLRAGATRLLREADEIEARPPAQPDLFGAAANNALRAAEYPA